MLMVITQHYVDKGGILKTPPLTFTWYFGSLLNIICYPCVLLFILISSYFLSFQEKFLIKKKIIEIWKVIFFYSIIICVILCFIYKNEINKIEILKSFFPVLFRRWGFVNNYLFLLLLSPALNIYLKNTTNYYLRNLLLILTIIQCIIPYISMQDSFNTKYGDGIIWFVYLYIISYYIRKNSLEKKYSNKIWFMNIISCIFLLFFTKILIAKVTLKLFGIVKYSGAFIGETPIINVLLAISIFCIFLKINIKGNTIKKYIFILSSTAFPVYLVHEHPMLKDILWKKIKNLIIINSSPIYQIICWLFTIICIYIFISLLELFRRIFFNYIIKLRQYF